MDLPISSVTIVGGGTAGWISALMLDYRLNRGRHAPLIRINLVESPTVPIIGVGEGSLAGLAQELKKLGVVEADFFRRCNATFKLGVRFVNWNHDETGVPYAYVHPVAYGLDELAGKDPLYHYLAFGCHPGRDQYDAVDNLDAVVDAIRFNRAPRHGPEPSFKGELFNYAYHFDAARLAEYLRDLALRRGIRHILDDVDDAVVQEGGIISHLKLRRNKLLPVDLVIDCTGFKGVIISGILKEPFVSYGSHLLCDRAIPIQLPYRQGEDIESCTTATALSAGWVWRIPLFNRIGYGYVYSSAFRSDDQALRELCQLLGIDPETQRLRVIQMRVGRVRRAWVGNCIAVGLAGAFVEPLEATAIMASMVTSYLITRHLPDRSFPDILRREFNRRIDGFYDAIRDFIIMHYFLANRPEPFWLAAREQTVLSASLRENLELWRYRLPDINDLGRPYIFSPRSYGINLAAKRFFRGRNLFYEGNVSFQDWAAYGGHLERVRQRVRSLPSARELLSQIRGERAWPPGEVGATVERDLQILARGGQTAVPTAISGASP